MLGYNTSLLVTSIKAACVHQGCYSLTPLKSEGVSGHGHGLTGMILHWVNVFVAFVCLCYLYLSVSPQSSHLAH